MIGWRQRVAVAASALALTVGAAGTASAGTESAQGWNGKCHTLSRTTKSFTGWCDGTGPQRYATKVYCTKGWYTATYSRWYGDRRGVYAACPSGQTRIDDGFVHNA
ncbi:hypothetical protein GCM10009535_21570 [Streptomyces thermocarboxydovorans]|uniref:Secreted protein n=1 Tax=Streptomyces thermocarboxydovorans TaxID=59298 RepID=A0ABN1HF74_9ACTN